MNLYDYAPYDSAVRGLQACERAIETARLTDGAQSEAYRAAVAALERQEEYVSFQRQEAERFFSAAEETDMFNGNNRTVAKLEGFVVGERGEIMDEPCGCPACDDGVSQGHFACNTPRDRMLRLELAQVVVRAYDDGVWRWFIAQR